MEKNKVKEFVKKYKLELALGVVVGTTFWVGYAFGKKTPTVKYHVKTGIKRLADFTQDAEGRDFYMTRNVPYKLSELGKLGESMIDADHPSDYVVEHIMTF